MKTEIKESDIIKLMERKDYIINTGINQLNIVGIRSADSSTVNKFNDLIVVFFSDYIDYFERINIYMFPATTKPGITYLRKLLNPAGTAVLVPGQYKYKKGLHKGKIPALIQAEEVSVYRDRNKNDKIDIDPKTITKGYYGINIHPAGKILSNWIGPWSAGCQVIQKYSDYTILMDLVEEHIIRYGNEFLYTLLLEQEINLFLELTHPGTGVPPLS